MAGVGVFYLALIVVHGGYSIPVGKNDPESQASFDQIIAVNQEASKLVDSSKNNLKRAFFEGDIVLTPKSSIYPNRANSRIQFGAVSDVSLLWPRKTIPFVLDDSIKYERSRETSRAVQEAFDEYTNKTCIKFKTRTDERDYIKLFKGGGCWSLVGRNGGRQDLSIGTGCEHKGVIVHELMHALGFWHEQSRPDRDNYVKLVTENILDGYEDQFKKYEKGEIDSRGSKYDYRSIMHYGATAFSKNGKATIAVLDKAISVKLGQRIGLSALDIQQISTLYKCSTKPIDGNWGEWSEYTKCSESCGHGIQKRFRECNSPPPLHGGEQCTGGGMHERACYLKECSVNCDFDRGYCMWTQVTNDDFDWRRRSGSTPSSGTGPSNDHTEGTSLGYYIYLEASSPQDLDNVAKLQSALITGSPHARCFSFWYHMFGATTGSLQVMVKTDKYNDLRWVLNGEQGNEWREGNLPIYASSGDFKITFIGKRGLDYRGDIAIDDIQLIGGDCDHKPANSDPSKQIKPSPTTQPESTVAPTKDTGINCNFETLNCRWKDTHDRDYIDWIRYRGSTVSKRTGPDVDHTLGTAGGYYLYIEGSSPQVTGDNARLVSPTISVDASKDPKCLHFFYFMYGNDVDKLSVKFRMNDNNEALLWTLKGEQGASWEEAVIPLPSHNNYQLVIEGVIGVSYLSDIAIDDISITSGKCNLSPTKAVVNPNALKPTVPPAVTKGTTSPDDATEVIVEVLASSCNDKISTARDEPVSSGQRLGKFGTGIQTGRLGFHLGKSHRPSPAQGRGRGRGSRRKYGSNASGRHKGQDLKESSTVSSVGRNPSQCSSVQSSIKVNGVEYGLGKEGHNIVLVNVKTGQVFGRGNFDTSTNFFAGYNLEQYISNLPSFTVFIIATQGSAGLRAVASQTYFPPQGGSLALAGYRGSQKIEWIKRDENEQGKGPSRLRIKFRLLSATPTTRKIVLVTKETFTGTTFLPIPAKYSNVLNLGIANFVLTAWIKTKVDGTIISKTGNDVRYNPEMKVIYITSGKIQVMLTSRFVVSGTRVVTDENWHHLALLVQGKTAPHKAMLYIDGRQEWQKPFYPVKDDATYLLKIGHTSKYFPNKPTFVGEIRNMFYYDNIVPLSVIRELVRKVPAL